MNLVHDLTIGVVTEVDPIYNNSWIDWAQSGKPIVLVTRHIETLYEKYPFVLSSQNIIVHVSLSGNGGTIFEPNIPTLQNNLIFFQTLSPQQKKRIVIRISPIIPINKFINNSLEVYKQCRTLNFEIFVVQIMKMFSICFDYMKNSKNFSEYINQFEQIYAPTNKVIINQNETNVIYAEYELRKLIFDLFPIAKKCSEPGFDDDFNIIQQIEMFGFNLQEYPLIEVQNKDWGDRVIVQSLCNKFQCPKACAFCFSSIEALYKKSLILNHE